MAESETWDALVSVYHLYANSQPVQVDNDNQTCLLPCVVWVKHRDSVCHSTRRQPLLHNGESKVAKILLGWANLYCNSPIGLSRITVKSSSLPLSCAVKAVLVHCAAPPPQPPSGSRFLTSLAALACFLNFVYLVLSAALPQLRCLVKRHCALHAHMRHTRLCPSLPCSSLLMPSLWGGAPFATQHRSLSNRCTGGVRVLSPLSRSSLISACLMLHCS